MVSEEEQPSLPARFVAAVGRSASWLTLAMVIFTFLIVLLRPGLLGGGGEPGSYATAVSSSANGLAPTTWKRSTVRFRRF